VKAIAHNTYIQLAAEQGVVGLLLFLGVLAAGFTSLQKTAAQALRLRSSLLYHSASGIQGGLVGYAVGAFFVSAEYQRLLWFMIFVSICLSELTRQLVKRAGRGPRHPRREATEAPVTGRDS
jgi:O-antigen ligase